jgi:hypothetical protein
LHAVNSESTALPIVAKLLLALQIALQRRGTRLKGQRLDVKSLASKVAGRACFYSSIMVNRYYVPRSAISAGGRPRGRNLQRLTAQGLHIEAKTFGHFETFRCSIYVWCGCACIMAVDARMLLQRTTEQNSVQTTTAVHCKLCRACMVDALVLVQAEASASSPLTYHRAVHTYSEQAPPWHN